LGIQGKLRRLVAGIREVAVLGHRSDIVSIVSLCRKKRIEKRIETLSFIIEVVVTVIISIRIIILGGVVVIFMSMTITTIIAVIIIIIARMKIAVAWY
jgi:hypothetical protein